MDCTCFDDLDNPPLPKIGKVQLLDNDGRMVVSYYDMVTKHKGNVAMKLVKPKYYHKPYLDKYVRDGLALVVMNDPQEDTEQTIALDSGRICICCGPRVYVELSRYPPGIKFEDLKQYPRTYVRIDRFLRWTEAEMKIRLSLLEPLPI